MLKLIDKLEKSTAFWALLGIFLLFFFLRLPSVIEPNWYGDEGIYQVLGMSINDGRILYKDAWDNKPPLLYLTYALFQGDHPSVRFFSLFVGLITTGCFFALSQIIFKRTKISITTTLLFTALFATPIIEGNIANAENFMLLPIILAALIIYKISNNHASKPYTLNTKPLFVAGLLLGIAFLFKIVAILDFAAFLVFLIIVNFPIGTNGKWKIENAKLKTLLHTTCYLLLGFFILVILTFIYFAFVNALPDFIRATFFGMFGYVEYGNKFIIPQGLLIIKILILVGIVGFLLVKRNALSKPTLFIILWLAFSLFNSFFSQRPYIHYMLVLVPSFCLLVGLVLNAKTRKKQLQLFILLLFVITTVFTTFNTYGFKKTFLYYQNALLFVTGQKNVSSYQAFFDGKTPRDYELASYIKMHTNSGDPLFVWGNSAQIYSLSDTLPITKFTVAYHMQQNETFTEIENTLNTIRPRYVILLAEAPNFPFYLSGYTPRFSIEKATIYEKTF